MSAEAFLKKPRKAPRRPNRPHHANGVPAGRRGRGVIPERYASDYLRTNPLNSARIAVSVSSLSADTATPTNASGEPPNILA